MDANFQSSFFHYQLKSVSLQSQNYFLLTSVESKLKFKAAIVVSIILSSQQKKQNKDKHKNKM